MIERRKNHCADEYARRQQLYQLLASFMLRSRTGVNSALEKLRIVLPQVCGNQRGRCSEDQQIYPRLPVIEGPCRSQQKNCQGGDELRESEYSFTGEILHGLSLSLRRRRAGGLSVGKCCRMTGACSEIIC